MKTTRLGWWLVLLAFMFIIGVLVASGCDGEVGPGCGPFNVGTQLADGRYCGASTFPAPQGGCPSGSVVDPDPAFCTRYVTP